MASPEKIQQPPFRVLAPEERYLNRELAWLDFDRRVLSLAEDRHHPLLERVKFLAITSRNLDEFFQVRVAGLHAQQEAPVQLVSPDGRSPAQQLAEIRARALELVQSAQDIFSKQLAPALSEAGVRLVAWGQLDSVDRAALAR